MTTKTLKNPKSHGTTSAKKRRKLAPEQQAEDKHLRRTFTQREAEILAICQRAFDGDCEARFIPEGDRQYLKVDYTGMMACFRVDSFMTRKEIASALREQAGKLLRAAKEIANDDEEDEFYVDTPAGREVRCESWPHDISFVIVNCADDGEAIGKAQAFLATLQAE